MSWVEDVRQRLRELARKESIADVVVDVKGRCASCGGPLAMAQFLRVRRGRVYCSENCLCVQTMRDGFL